MVKRGAPKRKPTKSFDGGGSRVKAANTWDEMEHDAEDDFHDSRGKILLDHEQDLARRYQDEDDASEEEVYGLDSEDEEDEDELSDLDNESKDQDEDEMDLDKKSWGKGKRSYYDAEEIESDEETAKAEEEEALRLQKKRLQEMSEEDFAPEEEETVWGDQSTRGLLGDKDADRAMIEGFDKELAGIDLATTATSAKRTTAAAGGNVVVEKITKANIGKLSKKEVLKVLQNQSPELLDLVEEFKEKIEALQAVAEVLQMVSQLEKPLAQDRAPLPFLRLKYQTLANYLTNIAFYITLKSSPGTDALELREHPVIDALVELRTMLSKLDKFENKKSTSRDMENLLEILEQGGDEDDEEEEDEEDEEDMARRLLEEERLARKSANGKNTKTKKAKKESKDKSKSQPFEYSVELEDDFVSYNKPSRKTKKSDATSTIAKTTKRRTLDDDYGDMDELLDVDLEDKAQKKRSLRDYVAKVDQAVNKRSKILRGSGDTDIPYRDRFKDRQEQMKRKAANQGPEPENTELDDLDWDEKDQAAARMVAGGDGDSDGDEGQSGKSTGKGRKAGAGGDDGDDFDAAAYYEAAVAAKNAKKAARKALGEEFTSATSFEDTSIDANDKRSISWQILKNKGLTPHRKKEQRNPRVKHRNKYETAKKKIKSVKRVFTRLEGAYAGEKTGIKTGLARSVKFS
ncbi:hypothetical protein DFQ27_000418 [Actinomortierella ambigua]|uniref:Sas10 C-terminal domain-containing protein n=1 Tax=Actinomortierella ambigua TaxID=1343610 RepID=A0A9P6UD58_9FUNG|nr:hypothetical protein DFQ27_000418 [Actinomortierella ambigua]